MYLLLVFFVVDYILTYIGIQRGVITEGNPLMVWLFEFSFIKGVAIRIAMAFLVFAVFWFIRRNYRHYKRLIVGINLFYSTVMVLHLRWLAFMLGLKH